MTDTPELCPGCNKVAKVTDRIFRDPYDNKWHAYCYNEAQSLNKEINGEQEFTFPEKRFCQYCGKQGCRTSHAKPVRKKTVTENKYVEDTDKWKIQKILDNTSKTNSDEQAWLQIYCALIKSDFSQDPYVPGGLARVYSNNADQLFDAYKERWKNETK